LASLHPSAEVIARPFLRSPIHGAWRRFRILTNLVRARFGVAESGAVWLTGEDLVVNAGGLLSQHLVVLRDSREIVADMHEAYARVRSDSLRLLHDGTFSNG
jgi:L-lactate utilization protein LutC